MIGVGLEEGIDAPAVATEALEAGLVINVPEPSSLRLLPPLVVGEDEIARATATCGEAIEAAGRRTA
jgi:acetylornithine aminotransferase